jgi:hypothetical protein
MAQGSCSKFDPRILNSPAAEGQCCPIADANERYFEADLQINVGYRGGLLKKG